MAKGICGRCKEAPSASAGRGYCGPCNREYDREYRKRSKSYYFKRFRAMGITEEQYKAMIVAQGGGCAICGTADPGDQRAWHIDHDHRCCPQGRSCGKCIRGLLCARCNRALGSFNDDPALLRRAADYVEVPKDAR